MIGFRLLSIVSLALLAGCTLAPPKLSVTVGTYVLKQGNQTKTGFALFSSFDPARSVPQQGFEIKVIGPINFSISRSYPAGKISDWFADPDKPASAASYTISAKVGEETYQFTPNLDPSSNLAPPEPELSQNTNKLVSASWKTISGAKVYYVTLNKLVAGQPPQAVGGIYTSELEHTFNQLDLAVGETYFVAVGALSLDPRIGYADLNNIPFNASYGQTRTFTLNPLGNLVLLGEAPLDAQVLQEYR